MNYKTFCMESGISYEEILIQDNPYVSKCYEINNPDLLKINAIPDGCIDIQYLWSDNCCKEFICGSFITGMVTPTGSYKRVLGLKLHPGVFPRFLCMPAIDINEKKILCRDLTSISEIEEIEECLFQLKTFQERMNYILYMLQYVVFAKTSDTVQAMLLDIHAHYGHVSVKELTRTYGYSQQHMNRLFKERVGFSVKKYAEIVRIQNAMCFLRNHLSISDAVFDKLGFYDQSHFINSFKKHTLVTPSHYSQTDSLYRIV